MRAVSPIRHRRPLCQLGRAPPLCGPLCRPSTSPPPTPLADPDAAACGSTVLPAGSRRPSSAHNSGGGNWSGRSPEMPALDTADDAPSDPGDDSSISRSATPARNNPERRDPSSIDQRGTNRTRATEGYGRAGGIVRAGAGTPQPSMLQTSLEKTKISSSNRPCPPRFPYPANPIDESIDNNSS